MSSIHNVEIATAKWLTLRNKSVPDSVIAVAETLYLKEFEALKRKECPFCGKVFKSRKALHQHLNVGSRSPCFLSFQSMVKEVVAVARELVASTRYRRGCYVALRNCFPSRREAYHYILSKRLITF